jgi:hypothetical protein
MNVPLSPTRSSRSPLSVLRFLPLGLLALLPAGCGPSDENGFAPACAPVGILGDAADYTDYGSAQEDLTTLVSQGSIVAVNGKCASNKLANNLHTVIRLDMAVTRGPAAQSRDIAVPYFIAVTDRGSIVNKQTLVAQAHFPANGTRVLVTTDPMVLDLPMSRRHPSTDYRIEVGFQLTPQQLEHNRTHRRH